MIEPSDQISVGRISKPHGLRGEVEVVPLTDFPQRFQAGEKFIINPPLPDMEELTIETTRNKNKKLVVSFFGISDRTAAENACGRDLMISAEDLADLPADVFFHHDLIGLMVETVEGRKLGEIKEVMTGTANDIYVVGGDHEYLIPAIGDVIEKIDIEAGKMTIRPLPGLLEL